MIEELQKFVKEEIHPLRDLDENSPYGFGEYAAVKDISLFSFDFENTDILNYNFKIVTHRITSENKLITRKFYRRIYLFYWQTIPDEIRNFVSRNKREIENRNYLSHKLILPQLKCEKKKVWFRKDNLKKIHLYIFDAEVM